MKCLIVGGTGFLGGSIVDALVAAGHAVTVLSRGETSRALPKSVQVISADRYGDLSELKLQGFQWVFDTCAYTPDAVHKLLDAVGTPILRYVMVSSISAYGTFEKAQLCESDPAAAASEHDLAVAKAIPAANRTSAFAYGSSYGPLKRSCEIAAIERLGNQATLLRVGLLVGAGDYTDRLTWWVRRIDEARGERCRVPAPAPSDRSVQLIDVRDAANFAVLCAIQELGQVWNVTGHSMPLINLLSKVNRVAQSEADLVWVSEDSLLEANVVAWSEMPLMAPIGTEFNHILDVDVSRAFDAGLNCRPIEQTLQPLLAWDRGRRDKPLECGLSPMQESLLLEETTA